MTYLPASIAGDPKARFATLLGLSHLSASLSWSSQAAALIGSEGLASAAARVSAGELDLSWPHLSLLSVSQSDQWLMALSWTWVLSALLLTLRVTPKLGLAVSLACAVSVSQASGPFLPFQWDLLLHEASLLGLLYLPIRLGVRTSHVSEAGRWALRALLFKLIWDSGVSKVMSGDELWRSLKALYLHFWTQPLPHIGAQVALALPEYLLRVGAYLTMAIELWVPWLLFLRVSRPFALWGALLALSFIGGARGQAPELMSLDTLLWLLFALALDERLLARWSPRLPRLPLGPTLTSAWAPVAPISLLMLLICATGSYGFFQLLTLSLCVPLFDLGANGDATARPAPRSRSLAWVAVGLWLSVSVILHLPWAPRPLTQSTLLRGAYRVTQTQLSPLQLTARYGLFARMTKSHAELIIEGSDHGERWVPYLLPYQVNGGASPPPIAGLHMPRVDWMLWFEALQPSCQEGWLLDLLEGIFQGRPAVMGLFSTEHGTPPRYLRVRRVSYTPAQDRFWSARDAGYFCPALSEVELRRARAQLKGLPALPAR